MRRSGPGIIGGELPGNVFVRLRNKLRWPTQLIDNALQVFIRDVEHVLVPVLIVLGAAKFALVAMFYMHLKYDGWLLTGVFVFPLMIATGAGAEMRQARRTTARRTVASSPSRSTGTREKGCRTRLQAQDPADCAYRR